MPAKRSPFRVKAFVSRPWWARPPRRAAKSLVWAWLNRKHG